MAKNVKAQAVNGRNIQFINQDITSKGVVEIRIRGHQAFIESETGVIRIGIGQITDKATGELKNRLYAHAVEKREHSSEQVVL